MPTHCCLDTSETLPECLRNRWGKTPSTTQLPRSSCEPFDPIGCTHSAAPLQPAPAPAHLFSGRTLPPLPALRRRRCWCSKHLEVVQQRLLMMLTEAPQLMLLCWSYIPLMRLCWSWQASVLLLHSAEMHLPCDTLLLR